MRKLPLFYKKSNLNIFGTESFCLKVLKHAACINHTGLKSEWIQELQRLLIHCGVIYAGTETENLFTLPVYGEEEITNGLIKEMEPDNAKERSPQSMTYWSCKSCPHRKLF